MSGACDAVGEEPCMELEVDAFERLRGVSADKLGLTGVRIGDVGGGNVHYGRGVRM
ncbi:hypothetical protein XVE_3611 [Xanthomonas vesicatoria ATCC 35937]|uniref:Uncharacterized protein n=1 Tax=Xanthomonas vesicatoria ATCC 35937 TaxID=925775 RepID=F0BH81_9XANT|nr:hypothetical protein XVE_3611 [Xanthomonas vesicatoria ATCC 35937]